MDKDLSGLDFQQADLTNATFDNCTI
ncbi:MAG: hypothetical protein E2O61_14400 [Gammaproteobacteria bacterium]|nr:MAG: hypothetical protein E2O61_14400 [Gammaproteobacteria bacterium]